jgi:hypothetical protein
LQKTIFLENQSGGQTVPLIDPVAVVDWVGGIGEE